MSYSLFFKKAHLEQKQPPTSAQTKAKEELEAALKILITVGALGRLVPTKILKEEQDLSSFGFKPSLSNRFFEYTGPDFIKCNSGISEKDIHEMVTRKIGAREIGKNPTDVNAASEVICKKGMAFFAVYFTPEDHNLSITMFKNGEFNDRGAAKEGRVCCGVYGLALGKLDKREWQKGLESLTSSLKLGIWGPKFPLTSLKFH